MKIAVFEKRDIPAATALWNECAAGGDMLYAPVTQESFFNTFMETPHYTEEYMLAARDETGALLGFGAGLVKRRYLQGEDFNNTPAYLTMLLTAPAHRGEGIAAALLAALEHRFGAVGKRKVAVTYRNPVTLTWEVPGSGGAQHNNAPGVEMDSPGFRLLCKKGYSLVRVEDGMYLPLGGFSLGAAVREKEALLRRQGVAVELYDPQRHDGFEELFDALHGEVWRETIRGNLGREKPLPVLIAADGRRIVGFAGPIDRESNGRGWFNGIATHPDYGRRGIATVLFHRLMAEFAHIGAAYSTLFTDEENPARRLYESVGFTVARRFAVLEKEM